jgi:hypothetical protein
LEGNIFTDSFVTWLERVQLPRNRTVRALLSVFGVLVLAVLLSRGMTGGDESITVEFADLWWRGGWSAIVQTLEMEWVAHRLFWCLEKLALSIPLLSLRDEARLHDGLMVLDGVLFMLAALGLSMHHLMRRGYSPALASLAGAALFLASSAVSFFSGGSIECQMFLYVVMIAIALDPPGAMTGRHFLFLFAGSGLLAFCKAYSVLFLLPLGLLLPARKLQLAYGSWILATGGLWALLAIKIGASTQGGMVEFYTHMTTDLGLPAIGTRFIQFMLSPPYGLLWSFPLLFICVAMARGVTRVLLIKLAGVLWLSVALCLFDFWTGFGAVAGQRYIVPYLAIFLPEIASGLKRLLAYRRMAGVIVPALVLFFLPSIEYRNSQIYGWNVQSESRGWGFADWRMHPAVFGWRVVAAKNSGAAEFVPSGDIPLVVRTDAIFPMTGISRILYALQEPSKQAYAEQGRARLQLARLGLNNRPLWLTMRTLMILALTVWLSWAALKTAHAGSSLV